MEDYFYIVATKAHSDCKYYYTAKDKFQWWLSAEIKIYKKYGSLVNKLRYLNSHYYLGGWDKFYIYKCNGIESVIVKEIKFGEDNHLDLSNI